MERTPARPAGERAPGARETPTIHRLDGGLVLPREVNRLRLGTIFFCCGFLLPKQPLNLSLDPDD